MSTMTERSLDYSFGGKEYKLKPLGPGDVNAFRSWLNDRKLKRALKADEWTIDEKIALIKEFADQPISEEEILDKLQTLEGTVFLIWRSLSKADSEISLQQVEDFITMENLMEVSALLVELMAPPKNGNGQAPKEARRKKTVSK